MKMLLRRIRGAVGMAATWTVAWTVLGICSRAMHGTESGEFPSLNAFLWNGLRWAIIGAIGGLVFGFCLSTDARPKIQQLSVRRAGMWGALSALAFPFAFEVGGRLVTQRPLSWFHAGMLSEFAMAGLLCGAVLVAVARRSARRETRAFSTNADGDELGDGSFVLAPNRVSARSTVASSTSSWNSE